jgi:hypothetical protein
VSREWYLQRQDAAPVKFFTDIAGDSVSTVLPSLALEGLPHAELCSGSIGGRRLRAVPIRGLITGDDVKAFMAGRPGEGEYQQ